ncbi:ribokinase [Paenibacillus sp. URB8-2]|uniref:ribokinase n=1 Tax=Paenibacillus sp. URB8-2 TaxID=2741301 RepID=UPI0015C0285D|nr:ribokinase [Paenibacillus sp. URB8-2]BCG57614.1 ribokinase [Paenibacillus sp. URB8-2]
MGDILVVGSINMDIINKVERHPSVGETISALETETGPGGKGANQAVAASRMGSQVTLAGAVGTDSYGEELLALLNGENVNTERIIVKEGLTGLAFITVNGAGHNHIIVSPGANGKLSEADLLPLMPELNQAKALIVQNEIPWAVSVYIIKEARARNVKVLANPAPVEHFPVTILPSIDLLIVNQHETEALTGLQAKDRAQAVQAAQRLLDLGGNAVVLTLGEQGVIYLDRNGEYFREALQVNAVDTTAAGDTFIGALASSIVKGKTTQEAVDWACAAAAICVTRKGAIPSIPYWEEVRALIEEANAIERGQSVK